MRYGRDMLRITRALVALAACGATAPAPAPPAVIDPAAEIARLASPDQATRDDAAARLHAHQPSDHDEAYWSAQLAARAKPGMTSEQFAAEFHATSQGGASSGQSTTTIWRLDDLWTVQIFSDQPDALRGVGPLARRVRSVWVDPPKDFTGRWVTYYVTGRVENDFTYAHGVYAQQSMYYDNGRLVMTRRTTSPGSSKAPRPRFTTTAALPTKVVTPPTRWSATGCTGCPTASSRAIKPTTPTASSMVPRPPTGPNGTKQVTFEYSHGVETGQAAWDEHGKLEYAHGSAKGRYR